MKPVKPLICFTAVLNIFGRLTLLITIQIGFKQQFCIRSGQINEPLLDLCIVMKAKEGMRMDPIYSFV